MSIIARITAMFLLGVCIHLNAGEITLRTDSSSCNSVAALDNDSQVTARRRGDILELEIVSQFNCARNPATVELIEIRNTATVSVKSNSESGMELACMCTHRAIYEVSNMLRSVGIIYYVQDGVAIGHIKAP